MSRQKDQTGRENSFSRRSVLVLALPLFLLKTRLSHIKQFEGNLALVAGVKRVADECQSLGLTVLGTALFFLGSLLEAESSLGKLRLTRPDARKQ